jgi:hypothetical protein
LLIDDSEAARDATSDLRKGLETFVARMHAGNEIALVTIGDRPTILVDYTKKLEELKNGIGRLFPRQSSGAYLLDAIGEVAAGFIKREAARPVILAVITEGTEFSNRHYEPVLEDLRRSGASLHALVLGTVQGRQTDEVRNRNIVLDRGTSLTGGRRDTLLASMAFPTRLEQVAEELSNQYRIVYARPQSLIPPDRTEVTAARPGLHARGVPVKPAKGA